MDGRSVRFKEAELRKKECNESRNSNLNFIQKWENT